MEKPDIETTIDEKIERLKKKKTKARNQKAVFFMKEAEQIFKDDFTPEVALAVLSDWACASETKKKEWITRSHSFRKSSAKRVHQKTAQNKSTSIQTGTKETHQIG